MVNYFSDNTLLRLHSQKLTVTKSKSVSFNPDCLIQPSDTNELSPQTSYNQSRLFDTESQNYTTRGALCENVQ